jgi:hypothetical protein
VVFSEDPLATYWHVIDVITGDTVLKDQTKQSGEVKTYPVVDGIQIIVTNGERTPRSYSQTGFSTGEETTLHMGYFLGSTGELFGLPIGGDIHFRSTYELRFTAEGSQAHRLFYPEFYPDSIVWDHLTPVWVPFEVWNTTTGEQVSVEVLDWAENGVWDPNHRDYLSIVNAPYETPPDPKDSLYYHAWFFAFATTDTNYRAGDVFRIEGALLNSSDDEFAFNAGGVDAGLAKNELSKIKVVPNPYIAHAVWETKEGIRKIQFTHLPDVCTIRIYTLAGDLVKAIEHNNNTGTEDWDMLSVNQQGIVTGTYFYHVQSKYGEKVGKFAVIK